MRIFEKLMIAAALLAVLSSPLLGKEWGYSLVSSAVALCLLHLVIERARWHVVPAYLAMAGLAATLFGGQTGVWATVMIVALLAVSAGLSFLLPVFSLPHPGGPYSIGSVIRICIRPCTNGFPERKLTLQFWYPSKAGRGRRSPYRRDDARGLKSHLRQVRTSSYERVPLPENSGRFPVIIFSPGWKGHLTQNTVQFELLASHGYIVVSVEHPPARNLPVEFDPSLQNNLDGYDREAQVRGGDIRFVIDQLASLNHSDPLGLFTGHFDLSRLGMFGYSFGGAVTAQACCDDERIRAGINLDGMLFGPAADAGVSQPFLFMSSDGALPTETDLRHPDARRRLHMQALDRDMKRIDHSLRRFGGYYLRVQGAAHSNFSDRPLYSPLRHLTDAGSISPLRAFEIINAYTLAFFEQHLKGKSQALLRSALSPYREADFSPHQLSKFADQFAGELTPPAEAIA
jgi:predicted dienelactone hydrolase